MATKQPAPAPAGGATAAAACKSTVSPTPDCTVKCQTGPVSLTLKPANGTVTIVGAEYPPGTKVNFTASTISFTVTAGKKDLQVSYAFAPLSARATLVENCKDQTIWNNNVNSSAAVSLCTVCTN